MILYLLLIFIFSFILLPYLIAYMSYIVACAISGQNIVSSIKISLKAPFNKNGTLSIFIMSEIALVLLFIFSFIKFYQQY